MSKYHANLAGFLRQAVMQPPTYFSIRRKYPANLGGFLRQAAAKTEGKVTTYHLNIWTEWKVTRECDGLQKQREK